MPPGHTVDEKPNINTTEGVRRFQSAIRRLSRPASWLGRKWRAWNYGRGAAFRIPWDQGFVRIPETACPDTAAAAASACEVVRRSDLDAAAASGNKEFLIDCLNPRELTADSPLVRYALNPELLKAVVRYLGTMPLLHSIAVMVSRRMQQEPWSSQLFHCDGHDLAQVKVFLHCSDIGEESGPLTILDASASSRVRRQVGYCYPKRLTDEQVDACIGPGGRHALTGPAGTSYCVDTSRCFHYGSRVAAEAPRVVALFQYLSPFALALPRSYWESAQLAHLDTPSWTPVQRAVLVGR